MLPRTSGSTRKSHRTPEQEKVAQTKDVAELKAALDALKADLNHGKLEFQSDLQAAKSETEDRVSEVSKLLQEQQVAASKIEGVVGGHSEALEMFRRAQMYIDGTMEKSHAEFNRKLGSVEGTVGGLERRMEEALQAVRLELAEAVQELRGLNAERVADVQATHEAIKRNREEIEKGVGSLQELNQRAMEAVESRAIVTCDGRFRAELLRLEESISVSVERQQERLNRLLQELREEALGCTGAAESRAAADLGTFQGEVKELFLGLQRDLQGLQQTQHKAASEVNHLRESQRQAEDKSLELRSMAERKLLSVKADSSRRLDVLESCVSQLQQSCAGAASLPLRQVEWHLENGLEDFRRLQAAASSGERGPGSLASPSFDAAGLSGLRLELLPAGDRQEDDQTVAGDCSLQLWAPLGTFLAFRLFVGGESVELRHSFDGEHPVVVRRICVLADQADADTGAIVAGFELFESSTVTSHGAEEQSVSSSGGEDVCTSETRGVLVCKKHLNHRAQALEQRPFESRESNNPLGEESGTQLSSSAAMSGGAGKTRRVQWRLEQVSKLRQTCNPGRPICSAAFQVAGVSGLQLVFYPSGLVGAKDGFCSFLVACPSGFPWRCWLWAGRWRKEARAEVSEKGDLIGRVNFCRFEECADLTDDSIELALEVEDTGKGGINGSTSSVLPELGAAGRSPDEEMGTVLPKSGRGAAVKQLPSIWSAGGDVSGQPQRVGSSYTSGAQHINYDVQGKAIMYSK
eukprot:TRINITY_DN26530_c1_g1_i2.p1 TRINITY_DN26530_c1_g1~~TRINITY_DN26530_c1_g1_i2.p1  ORF type:complete len:749 (+),score=207.67 TRINITY_DN26530_c1_g1_i2:144-2390(+)